MKFNIRLEYKQSSRVNMFKIFLPKTLLLERHPIMVRRRIACKSNQALMDIIIGAIAIGVITDVGATFVKHKLRKMNQEPVEVVEPIVVEDDDDGKSEAERVIDVDLE